MINHQYKNNLPRFLIKLLKPLRNFTIKRNLLQNKWLLKRNQDNIGKLLGYRKNYQISVIVYKELSTR